MLIKNKHVPAEAGKGEKMSLFGNLGNRFSGLLKKFQKITEEFKVNDYTGKYPNLTVSQIQHVLNIIDKNVETTAGFGLTIKPEHIEKEKIVFLLALDILGGITKIKVDYDKKIAGKDGYDILMQLFGRLIFDEFAQELEDYFDSIPQGQTRTKYNLHLEAIRADILQDIFCTKEFPEN